jgi:hypothetical protein
MGTIGCSVCVGVLGLCGLGSMNAALAAPPSNHHMASHPAHLALDLRPSITTLTATSLTASERPAAVFPSSLHRQALGAERQIELPALGTEGAQVRTQSRVEEFARRVHREGLPVARLWENKSALVSLGLNKKGKPGLWLIQKVH